MSDFLLNLLTRSFQPVMEIQPLATSPFEPPISARGNLAFGAEQVEDPVAAPAADDRSAESTDQLAARHQRVSLSEEQTVLPAEGDRQRALVTETQPLQRARPNAVAITPSAKFVIEQAPLATVPVTEDLRRFSRSETLAPRAVRPHEKVITSLSEAVIQSAARQARSPKTRQVFEAEPTLGQPPTTKTLVLPGAVAQPQSAQRGGTITSGRKSSPLPKQTSVNHLPAAQPGVETVIIERVTQIAEKTTAVSDARRTLIPKSIAAPPLVPNFNKRSKPQSVPIVQEQDPSQPETVINVSIGRIEVRATPPPAPKPERQRGASSVMGLDEYLRQRNGNSGGPGGRR